MSENNMVKNDMYEWNIISEEEFKRRIKIVFKQVSSALVKTFGPYGTTTIIEKACVMHFTKDGWSVLKKIRFGDNVANNILQILTDICAQVNIKVGDGSTTAIMAADKLLNAIENSDKLSKVRPKELLDSMNSCVEKICAKIETMSTKITDENIDDIYKIALVSTNGETKTAKMIYDIYKETKNPNIDYVKSKNIETTYEITEGFTNKVTYLDGAFSTNDEGTCEIDRPQILIFDHKIEQDLYLTKLISSAMTNSAKKGRRLVVIAPHYDELLLKYIARTTNQDLSHGKQPLTVYCYASLINNALRKDLNDYAAFTGAKILTTELIYELYDKFNDKENGVEFEKEFDIEEYLGECGHMSIGDKTTLSKGFYKKNDILIELSRKEAEYDLRKATDNSLMNTVYDINIFEQKRRLAKLSGKMSIIHVGGHTTLERDANYDLVEDAIKACECAYKNGYNLGGSLIIPSAIVELNPTIGLMDRKESESITIETEIMHGHTTLERDANYDLVEDAIKACECAYKNGSNLGDSLIIPSVITGFNSTIGLMDRKESETITIENEIMHVILEAFKEVFKAVMNNRYKDDESVNLDALFFESVNRGQCFNLLTETFSNDIINPTLTDIEVLKATSSIISMILSSNQYISVFLERNM